MTMKYATFIPNKFDQKELDARIKKAQSSHDKTKLFTFYTLSECLTEYEVLRSEGWTLDTKFTPVSIAGPGSILNSLVMVKPPKMIKAEHKQIADQVELEYKAELEAEQAEAVERMTARIVGEAKEKQIKEQAEAEEQAKLDAIAQAKQILGLNKEANKGVAE